MGTTRTPPARPLPSWSSRLVAAHRRRVVTARAGNVSVVATGRRTGWCRTSSAHGPPASRHTCGCRVPCGRGSTCCSPCTATSVYAERLAAGEAPPGTELRTGRKQAVTVGELVEHAAVTWRGRGGAGRSRRRRSRRSRTSWRQGISRSTPTLAAATLGWRNVVDWRTAIEWTVDWYRRSPTRGRGRGDGRAAGRLRGRARAMAEAITARGSEACRACGATDSGARCSTSATSRSPTSWS